MLLDEARLQALRLLSDQPGRIRAAALKLLKLQGEHVALEAAVKRRRLAIQAEVADDVITVQGKDGPTVKPRFGNADARAAATEARLERDETYQGAQKRLQAIEEELGHARIDLSFEQDVLGSARAAARILGGDPA